MNGERGIFLTFEGIDGSGKTTQAHRLAHALEAAGMEVILLREPGGTPIGERIRAILLDPRSDEMADECELLLMNASRAQLVRQVIQPSLERGAIVVSDRFFDSTFAYQYGGRGVDRDVTLSCNLLGSCGLVPDLTFLLDLDPQLALRRATKGGVDRLEAEGAQFQERVRDAYLELAGMEPGRVMVVDADASEDEISLRVASLVRHTFPQLDSTHCGMLAGGD